MSDRLNLAVTIAGAITLAFGIALALDWQRPYWAGLSVVVIGLPTMGESVFKGLQRLAGTAVAIPVAILFIALFAQERWLFALATSLWIGFCVWRMQVDSDHFYFWTCCGFIVPLLSLMSGFESANSFYTVVTRAKETVLGVLCFIAVGLLMSHRSARAKLIGEAEQQIALLRGKLADVRGVAIGQERAADIAERNAAIARRLMALGSLHNMAKLESFSLRERSAAWQNLIAGLHRLSTLLDRLDLTFDLGPDAARGLPASPALLPALDEFDARLQVVAGLLKSSIESRHPIAIVHPLSDAQAGDNPFERGEALLRYDIVDELDFETRGLQRAAADIADVARDDGAFRRPQPPRWSTLIPDREHLSTSLMTMVIFWLAFLLYIFVPALPDGIVVVIMAGAIGINLSRMPWIPAHKLLLPVVIASTYGGIAHILIMPHLSSYWQLGTMIFLCTFLLAWIFYSEEQQSARTISIILFMMTLQVSNTQTYSATYVMNIIAAFGFILLIITFAQHWPVSFKPERVVARLLDRYGRCMVAVLDGIRWDMPKQTTWPARQMRSHDMTQLLTIPPRLNLWIDKLPTEAVSDQDRAELFKLCDRLSVLSYRMNDLATLRGTDAERLWLDLLSAEVRSWRMGIQQVVTRLVDGDAFDPDEMRRRLDARLASLERLIAEAARSGSVSGASVEGTAHMQRVLSAYRGVSFAVMSVADNARKVTWSRLLEERF